MDKNELEKLSREELINKCLNQRKTIFDLMEKNKALQKRFDILMASFENSTMHHKIKVAYNETLSCLNDNEYLKNKIRKLEGK